MKLNIFSKSSKNEHESNFVIDYLRAPLKENSTISSLLFIDNEKKRNVIQPKNTINKNAHNYYNYINQNDNTKAIEYSRQRFVNKNNEKTNNQIIINTYNNNEFSKRNIINNNIGSNNRLVKKSHWKNGNGIEINSEEIAPVYFQKMKNTQGIKQKLPKINSVDENNMKNKNILNNNLDYKIDNNYPYDYIHKSTVDSFDNNNSQFKNEVFTSNNSNNFFIKNHSTNKKINKNFSKKNISSRKLSGNIIRKKNLKSKVFGIIDNTNIKLLDVSNKNQTLNYKDIKKNNYSYPIKLNDGLSLENQIENKNKFKNNDIVDKTIERKIDKKDESIFDCDGNLKKSINYTDEIFKNRRFLKKQNDLNNNNNLDLSSVIFKNEIENKENKKENTILQNNKIMISKNIIRQLNKDNNVIDKRKYLTSIPDLNLKKNIINNNNTINENNNTEINKLYNKKLNITNNNFNNTIVKKKEFNTKKLPFLQNNTNSFNNDNISFNDVLTYNNNDLKINNKNNIWEKNSLINTAELYSNLEKKLNNIKKENIILNDATITNYNSTVANNKIDNKLLQKKLINKNPKDEIKSIPTIKEKNNTYKYISQNTIKYLNNEDINETNKKNFKSWIIINFSNEWKNQPWITLKGYFDESIDISNMNKNDLDDTSSDHSLIAIPLKISFISQTIKHIYTNSGSLNIIPIYLINKN